MRGLVAKRRAKGRVNVLAHPSEVTAGASALAWARLIPATTSPCWVLLAE